jgi:Predicted transcription factor, homolog of eukaryotic MBF1
MEVYDFGLRLKSLREKRSLSQNEIAERLNVTGATISGYEANTQSPPIENLKKLALIYGVSADYLLGLVDREEVFLDYFNRKEKDTVIQIIEAIKKGFK